MVADKDVAVAFSGGLDSGVIAALCKRYARSVRLYTVGVEGSYDVRESEEISGSLGLEWKHIQIEEAGLTEMLGIMMSITGTTDPVVLSFEVPLMYILSSVDEDIVLTGQGADEVFLGYSKYTGLSDDDLLAQRSADMEKLYSLTRVHENRMADHFGKVVLCPFLDDRVLSEASGLGLDQLRPIGEGRKMPLRAVAESLGHPDIASKPKKAAQYGSGSMNMIKHLAKKRSQNVSDFLIDVGDGVGRE